MQRAIHGGLTFKQLLFCHKFIEHNFNAAEAYRQAYDTKTPLTKVHGNEGYKLIKRHDITMQVENIQKELAEKLEITTDSQVRKLENIYQAAYAEKEYTPAISAINSQSKHLGLIQDKPLTTVNIHMVEAEKQMRLISPEKRAAMLEVLKSTT